MKKKMFGITVALIVVCSFLVKYTQTKEEFVIYNSYKMSTDNYSSVILQVIVNKKNFDSEEIFQEVQSYYYQLEVPEELCINLYSSIEDLEIGNEVASREYFVHCVPAL